MILNSLKVVNYFEETQIAKAEHDETLGNILRMEDIYVDEWKELVRDAIAQLDETKKSFLQDVV